MPTTARLSSLGSIQIPVPNYPPLSVLRAQNLNLQASSTCEGKNRFVLQYKFKIYDRRRIKTAPTERKSCRPSEERESELTKQCPWERGVNQKVSQRRKEGIEQKRPKLHQHSSESKEQESKEQEHD